VKLAVAAALVIACSAPAKPPPPTPPAPPPTPPPVVTDDSYVEDFEKATGIPAGWVIGDVVPDTTFEAVGGVLKVSNSTATIISRRTATLKHALDAVRFRGKRVSLTAKAGCDTQSWWSFGNLGVDVAAPGAPLKVRTDQITRPEGVEQRVVVDIAADATAVEVVIAATGNVTCRIDDVTARILGPAGAGDEPPRALAGRALDNVVAFARLYGLVRYFHPSDEAAALDEDAWRKFLLRGVRAVESAPDAALAAQLQRLFAPVAPAVAISDGTPATAPAPTAPTTRWLHTGLGIAKGSAYASTRGAGDASTSTLTIVTSVDPALVRGKELEVKLSARGKVDGGGDAGLWIAEQRSGDDGFYTEPEMQPAIAEAWTDIVVRSRIADDAKALTLGVQVIGTVDVWFEPPVATVDGKPLALAAWKLAGPKVAAPWRQSGEGTVAIAPCGRARACVHATIAGQRVDTRPWTGSLGGGVNAMVPIELGTVGGHTVPAATVKIPDDPPPLLLPTDRTTRLVSIIIAWNIFQHFYPYFDVRKTDWAPVLPRALGEAALDDGALPFLATLRRLVHDLHDGHGSVNHPSENRGWRAPWIWERIDGKLVITKVAPECTCDLVPGDVVTAIDSVSTVDAFAAAEATMSAATRQHFDRKILARLSTGPEGGRITISVQRGSATVRVDAALLNPTFVLRETRPASGTEVAPGIRYVDIDTLSPEQLATIRGDLAAAKGVIIDVRGYPGMTMTEILQHATKVPISSAQWHIPTPARPDREGMTYRRSSWDVEPVAPFFSNVVFITDGRAVSAAETFMGIVENYKLGPIVGGPTAGTNGNINPFTLPGGYLIWWTGMKVLKHDGATHHGIGIKPTVPATRTIAGVAAGRDELLEKAIDVTRSRRK
jgi:C-terminal processing protease CtpA/Prc